MSEQEIAVDNQLKGEPTADNMLAVGEQQQLKPDDIAAAQAAEEAQIHAEVAAKKGISTPTQQVETPATATPSLQPAPAEVKPTSDYFANELASAPKTEEVDRDGNFVPLEEHVKLRKRAQAAEARAKELETQMAGVNASQFENLQIDDDVPVEGRVVKQLLAQQEQTILEKVGDTLSQRDADIAKAIAAQKGKNSLTQSQATARSMYPDFDVAIQTAKTRGLLFKKDFTDAQATENPGVALYLTAKLKLNAVGVQFNRPQTPAPVETQYENVAGGDVEIVSAQDLFASTIGGKGKPKATG